MSTGFVHLWRQSIESRVFKNPELWKVWTWCLMKASHQKRWVEMKTGRGVIEVQVNPGQFIFGRKSAARELGMPESSVRNRMKKLNTMQNIDIKEDTQYSVISIINWGSYQTVLEKEDSKEDRQRTGKGQAKDTDKKEKKERKKEENLPPIPPADGVQKFSPFNFLISRDVEKQIVNDWLAVRKTKRLANTQTAFSRIGLEIEKTGCGWNNILELCCERGWGGFKAEWLDNDNNTDSNNQNVSSMLF